MRNNKMNKYPLITVMLALVLLLSGCVSYLDRDEATSAYPEEEIGMRNIYVDFSTVQGVPLFKKIGMFSVGWVHPGRFDKTMGALEAIRPVTLRVDMGMGYSGLGSLVGLGSPGDIKSHYGGMTDYSLLLNERDILPYWCYFATPKAVQQQGVSKPENLAPVDYEAWQEICEQTARALKDAGVVSYGHEVYNEPDYADMFSGSWEEFLDIYEYGAKGVRRGDPDAVVGGGGFAYPELITEDGRLQAYLDRCKLNGVPLDFVSYHSYLGRNILDYAAGVQKILAADEELSNVRMQITEYNTVYDKTGNSGYAAAANFLGLAEAFAEIPDLEVVHWALFLSPYDYLGLLSLNDIPYAPYHAIQFYNNMPMTKVAVQNTSQVRAFASAEDDRACLALYNLTEQEQKAEVLLDRLPFKPDRIRCFRIDSEHSSYLDTAREGLDIEFDTEIDAQNYSWSGVIPSGGSVFFEITAEDSSNDLDARPRIGDYVRRDFYFANRLCSAYAYTDLPTLTTYLGMNGNTEGEVSTSLTFDNAADTIQARIKRFGNQETNESTACGIWVDFMVGDACGKTVYYSLAGVDGVPPGSPVTKRDADRVVSADESSFNIDINGQAPEGFEGRVVITMSIKDAAPDNMICIGLS
ncbi:MAG: hypothetical protein LBS19_09600 [Clostridiales bacterium]|jgi:hypothetical protein|nr:hypothetical protein [Clostridiales bacterium]